MNKKLIFLAFALSGMAALIYEVVWIRPLQIIFGSSVYAVSTMLTSFMAGLALGSFLISRYADKMNNPLKVFALLELGIAVYGIFIIKLFNWLPYPHSYLLKSFADNFFLFSIGQFTLIFLIMLIPTTLMGATWPVVNKALVKDIDKIGENVGQLYSANTFGAILGSFSAGFILIPLLGVRNSSLFAAFLNFFVAIIVFYYARKASIGVKRSEK